VILLEVAEDVPAFLEACGQLRMWDREIRNDLDAEGFLEANDVTV